VKPIWFIFDSFQTDGAEHEFAKWLNEAYLNHLDCQYVTLPLHEYDKLYDDLEKHKPPFICTVGAPPLGQLCPFTVNKRTSEAEISKYRGSFLCSPKLSWPHYVVPLYQPGYIFKAWDERSDAILCVAKLAEEFQYWRAWGVHQPLPQRQLISDPGADDCIDFLNAILQTSDETIVSVDIENIGIYHGKYKTKQRNRVPYVIGLCTDPLVGMSIGLAEYTSEKQCRIWRLLDRVLREKKQVGQNYYTHDLPWMQYLGFGTTIERTHDTLVRHHVLWPELSHKLDYQTFQYTREPYYKDEGKNWTVKERDKMKKYNVKDVCVTLEIYREQEKEFDARSGCK
jgi:hypothetical protein